MTMRNFFGGLFLLIISIFFVYTVIGGLLTDSQLLYDENGLIFGQPSGIDSDNDEIKPDMDQYIIDNCQNETGANNAVTSVVFDYRGFDTLGEATVLFAAVAGVILIFRRLKK